MGGSKSSFDPYSGPTPYTPSNEQLGKQYETMTPVFERRMKGEDVGFDPRWMGLAQGVLTGGLNRQFGELKRQALGRLQSQNVRGTIVPETLRRGYDMPQAELLSEAMSKIAIQDLMQKSQERLAYSGLYKDVWGQGGSMSANAANFALQAYQANQQAQAMSQKQGGSWWGPAAKIAGMGLGYAMGGPAGGAAGSKLGGMAGGDSGWGGGMPNFDYTSKLQDPYLQGISKRLGGYWPSVEF